MRISKYDMIMNSLSSHTNVLHHIISDKKLLIKLIIKQF